MSLVFLLLIAAAFAAFPTDGTCSTDLDALAAHSFNSINGASCSNGVWTVSGDFSYAEAGWWCYDHIIINGNFAALPNSLIQIGLNPDNRPGCWLDIKGPSSTFAGTSQLYVLTPQNQATYVAHDIPSGSAPPGVQYDYITDVNAHTADDSWQAPSITWQNYNAIDPCYRAGLISPGGGVGSEGGLTISRVFVRMPLGDCNTPTIVTGQPGPAAAIPAPSGLVPSAPSSQPNAPTPDSSPSGGGGGPSTDIPVGAIVGLIILAFLIVVVVVGTIVFVVVKAGNKPDKF